jgi:deoxyribodipyrimidine photo-lyase
MSAACTIFWFRQDLRLADNPALVEAISRGPVIPLFIYNPDRLEPPLYGAAGKVWLHESLKALDAALRRAGSRLIIRIGDAETLLPRLMQEWGASALAFNSLVEPEFADRDIRIAHALRQSGREVMACTGAQLLFEPGTVLNNEGQYLKVFTPFWKRCLAAPPPREPLTRPEHIPAPPSWPEGVALDALALLPLRPDWSGGIRAAWQPGEEGALQRLRHFLTIADGYADGRDLPAVEATSRLSPHLHFGEISPQTVWHAARTAQASGVAKAGPLEKFLSELGWREFSYHLLAHNPQLPQVNFKREFDAFPWQENPAFVAAWQRGLTGYPIVDAGMRELWHTGWMHNRVRMIVASLLTKHLLQPWQVGAAWFLDTLVDADIANNSASWQWVAGCGADAAPYFRIFNPITQGEKFDPSGTYVRRWVPEIARLPDAFMHRPWEAPGLVLHEAGVRLGRDYPEPIIAHERGRAAALAAYERIKKAA